eukprot:16206_1
MASHVSDNVPNDPLKSPSGKPSIIPFGFVDIKIDGNDNVDEGENETDIMNNFIIEDNDSEFDDDINIEKLEEKQGELLNETETPNGNNINDKQTLLNQLTTSKSKPQSKPKEDINHKKRKRYFDLLTDNNMDNIINDDSNSSSEYENDSSDEDSSDESDESDNEEESNDMNVDKSEIETKPDYKLSDLSKLEFEKLLSHTMVNLALKLEENDNKNMCKQMNPFANMDEQISLEINNELNMSELLSFISDDEYDNYNKINSDNEDINNPNDFETITPFEKSNNILPNPLTSSSNHPLNLKKSKLNTNTLSNTNRQNNTFIQEEIRLAEQTMKKALTNKMNIERKNYAPPLSSLDHRIRKNRRGDNAGRKWFNMNAGKLTPANKLHFLMLKYRHMLYRDYKPSKVKEDFVPKYFEMGTIIEGPTEFYSSRLTRKQRRSSWANEYMSNPSTKEWLEEKTRRAKHRIRKPGRKFWAPMRKLNVNNRYKLRKKIIRNRKKQSWKNRKNRK